MQKSENMSRLEQSYVINLGIDIEHYPAFRKYINWYPPASCFECLFVLIPIINARGIEARSFLARIFEAGSF